jgi:hypothetical protein
MPGHHCFFSLWYVAIWWVLYSLTICSFGRRHDIWMVKFTDRRCLGVFFSSHFRIETLPPKEYWPTATATATATATYHFPTSKLPSPLLARARDLRERVWSKCESTGGHENLCIDRLGWDHVHMRVPFERSALPGKDCWTFIGVAPQPPPLILFFRVCLEFNVMI